MHGFEVRLAEANANRILCDIDDWSPEMESMLGFDEDRVALFAGSISIQTTDIELALARNNGASAKRQLRKRLDKLIRRIGGGMSIDEIANMVAVDGDARIDLYVEKAKAFTDATCIRLDVLSSWCSRLAERGDGPAPSAAIQRAHERLRGWQAQWTANAVKIESAADSIVVSCRKLFDCWQMLNCF
jgi:hypothetical protein